MPIWMPQGWLFAILSPTIASTCFNLSIYSWIPARPDRHEQTMALCDSRPRVETRILYPGDSVHLQCRHESRAGSILWQKDNSTVDFTTGRLLLTVDGGVVVVNVRSWRTKHSSPIFTLSSIQATTSDAGLYGCSSQGQIVVLYKLIIDDGTGIFVLFRNLKLR